jgi:hypothetical protein
MRGYLRVGRSKTGNIRQRFSVDADHDLQRKSVDSAAAISLGSQRRMGLVLVIINPLLIPH